MNPQYDILVVGAGIAGASAALWLAGRSRVVLIDAGEPAGGASGAGAGLINPLLGRRARPVWRVDEALAAAEETIDVSGADELYDDRGVLRPARDAGQAELFIESAHAHPALATWLSAGSAREEFPDIQAEHGALRITRGGAIDITRFVERMTDAALQRGAELRTGTALISWKATPNGIAAALVSNGATDVVTARRVILAVGDGFSAFDALRRLNLHRVKGQTIRVRRPAGLRTPCAIPPVSGAGYIVPEIATWVLGSTYEHDFASTEPKPAADRLILEKVATMVPGLAQADVLERRAGVRVTVPGRRLPMVGPIDGSRIWVMTGFGSKGLLLAPYVARNLADWMESPESIPPELRPAARE